MDIAASGNSTIDDDLYVDTDSAIMIDDADVDAAIMIDEAEEREILGEDGDVVMQVVEEEVYDEGDNDQVL